MNLLMCLSAQPTPALYPGRKDPGEGNRPHSSAMPRYCRDQLLDLRDSEPATDGRLPPEGGRRSDINGDIVPF